MNPYDSLVETVRSQLSGTESDSDLEKLLSASGIPETMLAELLTRLRPTAPPPPPPPVSSEPSASTLAAPQLLVDWGVHPQVGHQSRPCFMILAPAHKRSRLKAEVRIDDELDYQETSTDVMPLGDGQWEFHVGFGLTSSGSDCRPGQYLIQIRLNFEETHNSALPRFFQSVIRLNIGDSGGAGPTLEIDGDGQSIVNLNGQDLRSFGRVVLRGSDTGVINVQAEDHATPQLSATQPATSSVTHEYRLNIDRDRQVGLPVLVADTGRQRLETAAFEFEDGRRVILLPKRRITLGRSRDNDVVIRFLPRSDEHDSLSRNISRTHLVLTLSEDGLLLTDDSKTGTALDFDPIEVDRLITLEEGDDPLDLELGITQRLRLEPFLGRLQLFGPADADGPSLLESDRAYCSAVGERISRLLRLSHDSGIGAVRLERVNNLAGREEYVCLYRQALIGSSHNRCAVTLPNLNSPAIAARVVYIGRTFWLENLGEPDTVQLNGQSLQPLQLAPLSISDSLLLGGAHCRFELADQYDGSDEDK